MFILIKALGCPLYSKPVLGRTGEAFTLVGIEAEPQCVSTFVALSSVLPSSPYLVLKSVTYWVVISWIGSVSFRFIRSGYSEEIRIPALSAVSLRISICLFDDYTSSTKKTSTSAKTVGSAIQCFNVPSIGKVTSTRVPMPLPDDFQSAIEQKYRETVSLSLSQFDLKELRGLC